MSGPTWHSNLFVKSFIETVCTPAMIEDPTETDQNTGELKKKLMSVMEGVTTVASKLNSSEIEASIKAYRVQSFSGLDQRIRYIVKMANALIRQIVPPLEVNITSIDTAGKIVYKEDGSINHELTFKVRPEDKERACIINRAADAMEQMYKRTTNDSGEPDGGRSNLIAYGFFSKDPKDITDAEITALECKYRPHVYQPIADCLFLGSVGATAYVGPGKDLDFNLHINKSNFSLVSGSDKKTSSAQRVFSHLTTLIADDNGDQYIKIVSGLDFEETQPLTWFEESNQVIDAARAAGKTVLVSCSEGISRSSTVVMAYLMSRGGLTLEQAICHVKSRRPVICPSVKFLPRLEAYDKALQAQRGARVVVAAAAGGAGAEAPMVVRPVVSSAIRASYKDKECQEALIALVSWVRRGEPCEYSPLIHQLFDRVNRGLSIGFKERIFNELLPGTGVKTDQDTGVLFTPVSLKAGHLMKAFQQAWDELVAPKGDMAPPAESLFM